VRPAIRYLAGVRAGLTYPTNFKDTHLRRLALALCVFLPGRAVAQQWPIKVREHVDLWLTAFAEFTEDTSAKVPIYAHDYVDRLALAQNQQGVLTALDSVHDGLQAHWDQSPKLAGARVLALDAATWDELHTAIQGYLNPDDGSKRRKKTVTPEVQNRLIDYFALKSDEEWLKNLDYGLDGARTQFFHGWWIQEELRRRPVLAAADSLWRLTEPKLQHFLDATHQSSGEIILSLPVDGDGVTYKVPNGRTSLAVPFPDSVSNVARVIYVFAHMAARAVEDSALAASTTVSERRSGIGDRYAQAMEIRGGYLLLSKATPELADGYARYYARSSGDLDKDFPLPDAIRDALSHQIDLDLK
jgi:hypothetical protein